MELTSRTLALQLWVVLILIISSPLRVWALTNITVDRNSGAIGYSPQDPGMWREAWPGVRTSGDGRAKATLRFNGSAIYYQGWIWSQTTMFHAQVDDRMPITLDLTNRGSGTTDPNAAAVPVASITILIAQNLTEATHEIVLSKGDGQREVIVGSFIYSTENPPASPSSPTTPAASSTSSRNSSPSVTPNLKVLLPSILGSVAFTLLVCLVLFMLWSRRRRRGRSLSADDWLAMPRTSMESKPTSPRQPDTPSDSEHPDPTGRESRRSLWFWGPGRSWRESRLSLTGNRGCVVQRDFRGVIPVVPADVKQDYPNWRID